VVEIESRQCQIEARCEDELFTNESGKVLLLNGRTVLDMAGRGELLVDGKVVDKWGSSWKDFKERSFEVGRRKAILRKADSVIEPFHLFVDDRLVLPAREPLH